MNELKFHCPECKQPLEIEASAVGTRLECPTCNKPILVPPTPEDADAEADGGLLGLIEKMLRYMIWGIFLFIFIDSPLRIWRFLVQTFPWFIRVLRVAVYGLIWAILSFWPFLALRYVPDIKSEHFSQMIAFTTNHQTGIKVFGYIWGGVCVAGEPRVRRNVRRITNGDIV